MSLRSPIVAAFLCGEAVRALLRQKALSALTALSVTIGIAALVWVVSIGQTGAQMAEDQLRALGDNLVWVEAGSRNVAGVRTGSHGTTSLLPEDAQAIKDEVPLIRSLSPQVDGSLLVIHGNRNWTTRYRGVTPPYLEIRRFEVAEGACFSDDDVERAANVCLIGQTVREQIFGAAEAVGQELRIGAQIFVVTGVLAPKGQSASGQDQDDTLLMPYSTAQKKIRGKGVPWLDDIMCSAVSAEAVKPAAEQITALMRQRHQIIGDQDDFNIRHPEELIKAQLEASRTFAMLLITIAGVALLVGGIGIMNMMLASVADRTREIGVRLAIGATEGAVQLQFLVEAVVLCLFGGLAGVALSVAGSYVLEGILGWTMTIPLQAVGLALAFSVVVGVFFGFYPARRAARMDPIAALKRE